MGLELGFWYFHNKKAWMTGEIFAQAMEDLDKEFREEGIHVTMLLDNFSGHKWREDKITNITFIFFSPNLTPHVQPADAGIIRNLKAKYGELRLVRSLDREEAGRRIFLRLTCSRRCTCLLKPGMPSNQRPFKHVGAIQEFYHQLDLWQALNQSQKSKLRLQMQPKFFKT